MLSFALVSIYSISYGSLRHARTTCCFANACPSFVVTSRFVYASFRSKGATKSILFATSNFTMLSVLSVQ